MFGLCTGLTLWSQAKPIYGKILNSEDISGIHILNTSSRLNTITNQQGEFRISALPNDTLVISSIKYQVEKQLVTPEIYEFGRIELLLTPLVNELQEVYLGRRLTGDLARDIKQIEVTDPINFDDVGIPGFKGKPQEKIPPILGGVIAPTAVNVEGLYKYLSGYYKMLRTKRKWEAENVVAVQIMNHYSPGFFLEVYSIPENRLFDFVLYCLETSSLQSDYWNEQHGKVHAIFAEKSSIYMERLQKTEE